MDPARARELLDQERERLATMRARVARDVADEQQTDPAYEDEEAAELDVEQMTDEAMLELARDRQAALGRAEERLATGTYGRSVRSGAVIPDERLEADPLAELTTEEAEEEARLG